MKFLFFFITLFTLNLQAQEKELVNFLNKELRWEVKNQFKNQDRIERYDTLVVVEPFQIKNGVLSITVKHKRVFFSEKDDKYVESYFNEKQEVDLNKITKLTKDINVIFVTQPDAVKISENGIENRIYSLFFLQLCCSEKYNEIWARKLIALFEKAGYDSIEMENWYD
jgi:Fe-S oxidoreductase